MPKKTRQEKIIAELRRRLATSHIEKPRVFDDKPRRLHIQIPSTNNQPLITNLVTNHQLPTTNYSYVFSDLRRITFITIGLLSVETVIYYFLRLR